MSEKEVTAYINALEEPKRSTLLAVRETILSIEPKLEQVISWNSPQFKYNGKYVVGFCAFKKHLTFSPQSDRIMAAFEKELASYVTSKSSFQFDIDKPLPRTLLSKLIKARLKELR